VDERHPRCRALGLVMSARRLDEAIDESAHEGAFFCMYNAFIRIGPAPCGRCTKVSVSGRDLWARLQVQIITIFRNAPRKAFSGPNAGARKAKCPTERKPGKIRSRQTTERKPAGKIAPNILARARVRKKARAPRRAPTRDAVLGEGGGAVRC
jgi:hypothetical protein